MMSTRKQPLCAAFGRAPAPVRRGFTMIEMLIVVTILGIMTTLAMVNFTKVIDQARVDRAATTLSYDLQMAFALVGRNRKPVRITWDSMNVRFNVTDRTDTLFRTRPMGLSSEFKLRRTDFVVSRPVVEIYPPGLANDSLNIRIVNRDTKRTISMARGGLVRVLRK
jgi:prepilin-type N-terminal cleavage/methylation domain-containing protein